MVLAPVVAEVIFGATTFTNLGALLPDLAVYGCGALLIRELVRRRGLGWPSILLLGMAFGIIEEGLALGSLFNADLFNAGALGGRALGVNGVWTAWTLGYHAVWSISTPILLVELLFPDRRAEPWLGRVGPWVAGAVYALGVAVFAAIFHFVVAPDFTPTVADLAGAVLAIVALVALALNLPSGAAGAARRESDGRVPAPWLVGVVAFLAAGAWFLPLVHVPHTLRTGAGPLVLLLWDLTVVAIAVILLRRWSALGRRWTDLHRLAFVTGVMPASMLYGVFFVTADLSLADRLGQGIASLVALVLLAAFAYRIHRRVGSGETGSWPAPRPGEHTIRDVA